MARKSLYMYIYCIYTRSFNVSSYSYFTIIISCDYQNSVTVPKILVNNLIDERN